MADRHIIDGRFKGVTYNVPNSASCQKEIFAICSNCLMVTSPVAIHFAGLRKLSEGDSISDMRHSAVSIVSILVFFLLPVAGCTLAFHRETINDGFAFPSENVRKIIKGKTTGDELVQLIGGPLAKYDMAENIEEWRYSYTTGVEIQEQGLLSDYEYSEHHRKTLDIVLRNVVVEDFIYSTTDCVLPVAGGGGDEPSPASVRGVIAEVSSDQIVLREKRGGKSKPIRFGKATQLLTEYGGSVEAKDIKVGQHVYVWFDGCKVVSGTPPIAAVIQLCSTAAEPCHTISIQ